MDHPVTTLDRIPAGGRACIRRLDSEKAVLRRLLDFGFVPGGSLKVIRFAPLGDPMTVRIGDDTVAVRRAEAARIEVTVDD